MLQAIYTAVTGMKAQQYNIDTIGNNIANINTSAFTSSRIDFADTLYEQMRKPIESGDYLQEGTGSAAESLRITASGSTMTTGRSLDFMLTGPGYFTVRGAQGVKMYTRDGSFKAAMSGNTTYLVTAEGYPVLDANNQPIVLPGDAEKLSVDIQGNLTMNGAQIAKLQIATFANPEGLASVGANKFTASEASGLPAASPGTTVQQGCLEGSNVDLATELTRLMRAQRAYAVLGSAIRTADEMESLANTVSK